MPRLATLPMLLERMTVVGDDSYGYTARFSGDPNGCWAMKRETAIAGCEQRRNEVLCGKLVRGVTGYYSPGPAPYW